MSHKTGQIFETRDLDLWTSNKFIKTFFQQDDFCESHWTVEALKVIRSCSKLPLLQHVLNGLFVLFFALCFFRHSKSFFEKLGCTQNSFLERQNYELFAKKGKNWKKFTEEQRIADVHFENVNVQVQATCCISTKCWWLQDITQPILKRMHVKWKIVLMKM